MSQSRLNVLDFKVNPKKEYNEDSENTRCSI